MDRILFVDDDLDFMEVTQQRLNNTYQIDISHGGREGINAVAEKGPYAAIITGLHMKGMNGFQFVAKAKKIDPDSVIIMLTGRDKLDVTLKAMNGGKVLRFLTKPCKSHVLDKALKEAVERYRKNHISSRKPESEPSQRHKILIVDDDPEVLSVFAAALRAEGRYDVLTAENGKIALELIKFIKMDVVAAGLNISDMNGIQLLKAIRRREPDIGLFLMTWHSADEFQGSVEGVNPDTVFEKPLDMPTVLAVIRARIKADPKREIEGFSTSSFLQMIEMEAKTCTLQVRSGERLGFLFFRKGRLIAARTKDKKNEKAAYDIINWKGAAIEVVNEDPEKLTEINLSLMQILVEAARIQDESKEDQ